MPTRISNRLVGVLFVVLLSALLHGAAWAQPLASDSSYVIPAGGEAPGILYYQYVFNGSISVDSSIRVWRFNIRDGGGFSFDKDRLPTVLDTLAIHVSLSGTNPIITTRSIASAELFTGDSQLVATAIINDSTLVFKKQDGAIPLLSVPDDSTVPLYLYIQLQYQSILGDQFLFKIGPGDAYAFDPNGETSTFGTFPVAMSDTTGVLNQLVTKPKSLLVRTFDSPLMPNVPFGCQVIAVDTLFRQVKAPPGQVSVTLLSQFGVLSGPTSVSSTGDQFVFSGLTYPYRNDKATMAFVATGFDTLFYDVQFTGGAPDVPTVTNLSLLSADSTIAVDGTGVTIHFGDLLTPGSFLTERIDSLPPFSGPLPLSVNTVAPRYFRLTADRFMTFTGPFVIGLPIDGITSVGNPYGLKLMTRPNGASPWSITWQNTFGGDDGRIFGSVDSFGEVGLGINRDVALPIQLVDFSAANSNAGIQLDWRTASEVDNAGYRVARSPLSDGPYSRLADFQTDASLAGLGTSPAGKEYRWIDADPGLVEGTLYYYRLEEVSMDGSVVEHGPIAVEFHRPSAVGSDTLTSYPNPFSDRTTLQFYAAEPGAATILLVDALGRVATELHQTIEKKGMISVALDGGSLPAGSYFYQIRVGSATLRGVVTRIAR